MKPRYRLIVRSARGDTYYCFDTYTNSKAVHRAYARKAQVTLPPLEDYEKSAMAAPVIPLPISTTA